jgi:hypothetical protein
MKKAVPSILSSFAGNGLTAIDYVNARKPLAKGARDDLRKDRRRKL